MRTYTHGGGLEEHRDKLIEWLEVEQAKGSFEGLPEDVMDFKTLSDNELEFYLYNWFLKGSISNSDFLVE